MGWIRHDFCLTKPISAFECDNSTSEIKHPDPSLLVRPIKYGLRILFHPGNKSLKLTATFEEPIFLHGMKTLLNHLFIHHPAMKSFS